MIVAAYLLAIVTANLTIATFGPAVSIVNAFLFIGFDLVLRDTLHDQWRGRNLARNMALLIAAGGALSYAFNPAAGRIALASTAAFTLAATVDAITYHALRRHPFQTRANGSNIPAALVDSITFPTLAFGGFMWPIMLGQFIAKVAGGAVWAWLIAQFRNRMEAA